MSAISFVKGMIAGVAVGGACVMLFDPITPRQRKRVKRQAAAAWRSFAVMADDLMHMKK